MNIIPVPALQDNYMYLVIDKKTREAAAVDPAEPEKLLSEAKKEGVTVNSVLTTHHHWDHSSGNEKIVELLGKKLIVYGGDDRIPAMTKKVTHGDEFKIGSLMVKALFTPCHTSGHICYHVTADEDPPGAVFTGDTLFVGSCGKFFEGTANQMYTAMYDILGKLPEDTKVYCGHEYGLMCMKYCVFVEPSNQRANEKLIWAQEQRQNNLPTVPSTIADEKLYNPFMRVQ
jgi:hydroxyacylglutathione hydrolase